MKNTHYSVLALAMLTIFVFPSCDKTNSDQPNDNPNEQTSTEFKIEAVDLGLSVKWANANLGATSPKDAGNYYAWGETETKESYTWDNYKFFTEIAQCEGVSNIFIFSKYSWDISIYDWYSHKGDNLAKLDLEDDAAHVLLKGDWRMPTREEEEELLNTQNNPNYIWELDMSGTGVFVTYKKNNNSIYIPFAGHMEEYYRTTALKKGSFYWTSTLLASQGTIGWYKQSEYADALVPPYQISVFSDRIRCNGAPIRPVKK